MGPQPLHFFIPVYHDARSFTLLREKVQAVLPGTYEPHFHLLDDSAGSDPEIPALAALPGVSVQAMPRQLGHQRALVRGLRAFRGQGLVVTMDGDGEDRPEDLPALLAAHEQGAIVLARRTHREETPLFRLAYFFYKRLFRLLTGTVIQTGNFAVFDAETARALLKHPFFRFSYASSLFALGARVILVPCPRGSRYFGRSRMGFRRLAVHGLTMLIPFAGRIAARGAAMLVVAALAWHFIR